jgi:hypothetical protein
MPYSYFIGIDPGKTGAISLLTEDPKGPVKLWAMPKTPSDIWDFFAALAEVTQGDQFVMLERVHSMPRDSAKGAFTFGKWVAYVEMALIGNQLLPMDTVRPQEWMGKLGCMTKGDKNVTKAKAQQLFPGMKIAKYAADGLLIGYYAREVWQK